MCNSKKFYSIVAILAVLALILVPSAKAQGPTTSTPNLADRKDSCGRPLYDDHGQMISYEQGCNHKVSVSQDSRFEQATLVFATNQWGDAIDVSHLTDWDAPAILLTTGDYSGFKGVFLLGQNNSPLEYRVIYSDSLRWNDAYGTNLTDIDNDGYFSDLVAFSSHDNASVGNGGMEVWRFNPAGFYEYSQYRAGENPYGSIAWPGGAATANWNDTLVSTWVSDGSGGFTRTNYPAPQAGWNDMSRGDLNGDNVPDLVSMWGQLYANPWLSIYPGLPDGTYGTRINYQSPVGNVLPNAITTGDINRDGRDDLVVVYGGNQPTSKVAVFLQDSNGNLVYSASYRTYEIPESVAISDVNCDDLMDIVITNAGWESFSWMAGDGNGSFGAFVVEPLPFYFSHIGPSGSVMYDIDGDGLDDYLVVSYNHGVIASLQKACPTPPTANIYVAKSATANACVGEPFTYTIHLGSSTQEAQNAIVTDTMPANIDIISIAGFAGSDNYTVTKVPSGTLIVFTVSYVDPLIPLDAFIVVSATTPGVYTNTVLATSSTPELDPLDNYDWAVTTVTTQPPVYRVYLPLMVKTP